MFDDCIGSLNSSSSGRSKKLFDTACFKPSFGLFCLCVLRHLEWCSFWIFVRVSCHWPTFTRVARESKSSGSHRLESTNVSPRRPQKDVGGHTGKDGTLLAKPPPYYEKSNLHANHLGQFKDLKKN